MAAENYSALFPSLAPGTLVHGFAVEKAEVLPEVGGSAYIMRHQATGARLMWLACDDANKAFAIGFKTPPADDTGVFHINEHSVLCGSRRFPVKEPFVNLLKTSMQTFLNAMTFSDKTMYPVSSTNEQDLLNLMDVYLDAVLHPAIYEKPHVFEQEGWHYEVAPDGSLVRNGVVFNEMKGGLSDPDRMLLAFMNRELFPRTAYGFESGGDPKAIPSLTYEDFIDANARHYRLDNSYTVLYGDLDIDRMLAFIGERFDGEERRDAGDPNPLDLQEPVAPEAVSREMRTVPENAAIGLGYVFATAHDHARVLAASVLIDTLMGSNEAPLKRAILDAGLGDDAVACLIDGQLQIYAFLELKGAKPGVAKELQAVIERTCRDLAEGGIPRGKLESALAQAEFHLREGNPGMADGVMYAIQALEGWLYDDALALEYLRYEDDLAELREMLDNGGFERLLGDIFLNCNHRACVNLVPVEAQGESDEERELARMAAELGDEGMALVRERADALRVQQETPDSPEALATLPQLHVRDIGAAPDEPQPFDDETAPLQCIAHEMDTRKIDYVYHYFDLAGLEWDELPYASLLTSLLGRLGTRKHDASELVTAIDGSLGTLDFSCRTNLVLGSDEMQARLVVSASALAQKVQALADLPREVWGETLFDDRDRIIAILAQERLAIEQSMAAAGHSWAMSRMNSYGLRNSLASQQLGGVDYYLFLRDLIDHFDDRYEQLVEKLHDVSDRIFCAERACVSFVGSADERARYWDAAGDLGLPAGTGESRLVVPQPVARNEAFVVPADGCFVAHGGQGGADVARLTGSWLVAARALSLDYLWNEVRVKGGAYGCGFMCGTSGWLTYYSYRDPAVDPTLERFGKSAAWLEGWNPTADELEGYIVSNVAKRDAPHKPRRLAKLQDMRRFAGVTDQLRATIREEIITCTAQDVRDLARPLREASDSMATCVFGGASHIAASSAGLETVTLIG